MYILNFYIDRKLTLTLCNFQQFNCIDGSCISIDERCDGKVNCKDGSDEDECKSFTTSLGYRKHLVPAPTDHLEDMQVSVSINVDEIIAIDEANGYLRVKNSVTRDWKDDKITFLNLKKEASKNLISNDDMSNLWYPWIVFHNIESRDVVKLTDKLDRTQIIPSKEFKYVEADQTNLHITRFFKGSENLISMQKQYYTNWMSAYNMKWYPFDKQRIYLMMYPADNVTLVPRKVGYSGPKVLPQHYVNGISMCSATVDGVPGIVVELVLSRPLFSSILTVFMPTGIMLVLSLIVRVFYKKHVEMVISVHLTLLLVLATL